MQNFIKTYSCTYTDNKTMCLIPNPKYSIDKNSQIEYICEVLQRHEKEHLYDIRNKLYELNDKRVLHIKSCFHLGIYFYENNEIKKNIDNVITWLLENDNPKEQVQGRFKFVWMLICMFHDIGYVIEEKCIENNKKELSQVTEWFGNMKLKKPRFFPKRYSLKMLKKYEHYREDYWKKIDHGIFGGLVFLNEVLDLRNKKEKEKNKTCNWDESLIDTYNLAAWTIMCHNIYKTDKEKENAKLYKCYGLENLIKNGRIINLKNHPLLYLFCLVDSIEPYKNGIENIQMTINQKRICIKHSDCIGDKDGYLKKIYELKEWLADVTINSNDNTIEISL